MTTRTNARDGSYSTRIRARAFARAVARAWSRAWSRAWNLSFAYSFQRVFARACVRAFVNVHETRVDVVAAPRSIPRRERIAGVDARARWLVFVLDEYSLVRV